MFEFSKSYELPINHKPFIGNAIVDVWNGTVDAMLCDTDKTCVFVE